VVEELSYFYFSQNKKSSSIFAVRSKVSLIIPASTAGR